MKNTLRIFLIATSIILLTLTGCSKIGFLFQPIVNADPFYNTTTPVITWEDPKLGEGESLHWEIHQYDANGLLIPEPIESGSGGNSWTPANPLVEGKYAISLWKSRTLEEVVENTEKTTAIFIVKVTGPTPVESIFPNGTYSSILKEVDGKSLSHEFMTSKNLSWKWTPVASAIGYKVRAGKGIATILENENSSFSYEYSLTEGEFTTLNSLIRTFDLIISDFSNDERWLGPYVIEVRAIDEAGNISASNFHGLWVDLEMIPGPTLKNPSIDVEGEEGVVFIADTNRTNDQTPKISWLASHPEGFSNQASVYQYQISNREIADENKWATVDLGKGDLLEYAPVHKLQEGNYFFIVRSVFEGNRYSANTVFSFTIDVTPPALPIITIDKSTINFLPTTVNWTTTLAQDVVSLEYQYADFPIESILEIDPSLVFNHSEDLGDETTEGVYSFHVRSIDALGNKSNWTVSNFEVSFLSETDLVLTVSNASYNDITKIWTSGDLQPVFTWIGDSTATEFSYYFDKNAFISTPSEGAIWTTNGIITSYKEANELTLVDGEAKATFFVRQKVADVWSEPEIAQIVFDFKAPESPVVTSLPIVGADPETKKGYPVWNWTKSDDAVSFKIRLNSGDSIGNAIIIQENSYTKECLGNDEGIAYTLEVQASDSVGNWSPITATSQSTTRVSTDLPPAPNVTLIGDHITAETEISWTWDYTDIEAAGYTVTKVWVQEGSSPNGTGEPYTDGQTETLTFTLSPNTEVQKSLYVVAECLKDGSVINSTSGYASVLIDHKAPEAPFLSGDDQTGDLAPSFFVFPNNESDHAGYRWQVQARGEAATSSWISADASVSSITVNPALSSTGYYVFYLQSRDAYENWSATTSKEFEVIDPPQQPTDFALVNPIIDNDKTNLVRPSFSFTYTNGLSTLSNFRYRAYEKGTSVSVDSSWTTVSLSGITGDRHTFEAARAFAQGELVVELRVGQNLGGKIIYSPITSINIFLDSIAPTSPIITYLSNKTSDVTPELTWNPVLSAVNYSWVLSQNSTEIASAETSLAAVQLDTLEFGSYTFTITAEDIFTNVSSATIYNFEVGKGAGFTDPSVPGQPIITDVSKCVFGNAIRIQLALDTRAKKYIIYRLSQDQISSGITNGALGTPLLTLGALTTENKGYINTEERYSVFYDTTLTKGDTNSYYYAVVAANDSDVAGPITSLLSASDKEKARGQLFSTIQKSSGTYDGTDFTLSMPTFGGQSLAYDVEILSSTEIVDPATIAEGWNSAHDSLIEGNPIDIDYPSADYEKLYYFKAIAVQLDPALLSRTELEGVLSSDSYFSSEFYSLATSPISSLPFNPVVTVGKNDANYEGKIPVSIALNQELAPYKNLVKFRVYRTYGWGGGHRGSATGVGSAGYDVASNGNPFAPNPDNVPDEKTIMAYEVSGADFDANGKYVVQDTLYDVKGGTIDTNGVTVGGDKLIASVCLNVPQNGYQGGGWSGERPLNQPAFFTNYHDTDNGTTGFPCNHFGWYELTQAEFDYSHASRGEKWYQVQDMDGALSEHEWHYLKWDWAIRKQLGANKVGNGSSAFANFDFEKMITAKYKVEVVFADGSTKAVDGLSGYPALTPREITFLSSLIREITFYEDVRSYEHAIIKYGSGFPIVQPSTSDQSHAGLTAGTFNLFDASLSGVSISTTGDVSILKGLSMKIVDNKWSLTNLRNNSNNGIGEIKGSYSITVPIYGTATIALSSPIRNVTYWLGNGIDDLNGTLNSSRYIKLTYGGYNNACVFQTQMNKHQAFKDKQNSGWHAYASVHLFGEYASHSYMATQQWNDRGSNIWTARFTDINFTYEGKAYPGF